jgi:hypothetical protein
MRSFQSFAARASVSGLASNSTNSRFGRGCRVSMLENCVELPRSKRLFENCAIAVLLPFLEQFPSNPPHSSLGRNKEVQNSIYCRSRSNVCYAFSTL